MPQPSTELTAFIIEDEPDLVHIFARALELSGYKTETTGDGVEALNRLANMVPDVIVLDLHLPGVSGKEILQAIRADGRFQNTHVIIATTDYHAADEVRDDADLILLKPISFKQLRDLSARLSRPSAK